MKRMISLRVQRWNIFLMYDKQATTQKQQSADRKPHHQQRIRCSKSSAEQTQMIRYKRNTPNRHHRGKQDFSLELRIMVLLQMYLWYNIPYYKLWNMKKKIFKNTINSILIGKDENKKKSKKKIKCTTHIYIYNDYQ